MDVQILDDKVELLTGIESKGLNIELRRNDWFCVVAVVVSHDDGQDEAK